MENMQVAGLLMTEYAKGARLRHQREKRQVFLFPNEGSLNTVNRQNLVLSTFV